MVAEPSDQKGQPLVRAPRFQVMLTFMALLALVAADGGGNDELGALGMAESFVNMPEEPEAEEHHMVSCRKFEAYDLGDAGRQGEGQQGVQQTIWTGMHTWTSHKEKYNKPMDKPEGRSEYSMGMRAQKFEQDGEPGWQMVQSWSWKYLELGE